jgi:phosphoglucomutase
MSANIAGTGMYVSQELIWKEQRIQFKFSSHRIQYDESLKNRADELYGSSLPKRLLKDYNAQTYWLSFNIKSFNMQSSVPPWLNLALGYGAEGLFGGFENIGFDKNGTMNFYRPDIKRVRQWYLAPDIDFTKIKTNKIVKWSGGEENIIPIGKEIDEAYIKMVKSLSVYPEVIAQQKDLKIVFTSIHGAGITLVPRVLKEFGFENVTIVEEQATPDGAFPTVVYPNPEESEAMSIGLKKANELDADILLGTDPDADRVGIGVKDNKGKWILMNGNQTAVLAFNYMIESRREKGIAQPNDMVVKTIVTTGMIDVIAEAAGVKCYNVLTGFKWIAELIKEKEGEENYVIGGEESYGLMIGSQLRDKDAVSAVALLCEMAAYEKNKGRTLYQKLIDLYVKYGFYKEHLISITKKGMNGQQEIAEMMEGYRSNPPQSLGGSDLVYLYDYQERVVRDLLTGGLEHISLPQSNVLQFITADGSKISARPSGTEPKIKFYFSVHAPLSSADDYEQTEKQLEGKRHQV